MLGTFFSFFFSYKEHLWIIDKLHPWLLSMSQTRQWIFLKTSGFFWVFLQHTAAVRSLRRAQLFATPWTAARQASLSFTISQSLPGSCPLSQWYHPTISLSVAPFSSCPQSFLASGSLPTNQLFASGGQRTAACCMVCPVSPRKLIHLCLMLLPQPVQPSLGFYPQNSCLSGFQTKCRLYLHLLLCLRSQSHPLSWLPTNSPTTPR